MLNGEIKVYCFQIKVDGYLFLYYTHDVSCMHDNMIRGFLSFVSLVSRVNTWWLGCPFADLMPCDCEKYRILCYKFSFSFQTTIPYPAEVAESIYQVENIPIKHGDDEDGPYQEMNTAWKRSSGFSRGASIYWGVTRHHQHGRWQSWIDRVAGNKDLYLGTFSKRDLYMTVGFVFWIDKYVVSRAFWRKGTCRPASCLLLHTNIGFEIYSSQKSMHSRLEEGVLKWTSDSM